MDKYIYIYILVITGFSSLKKKPIILQNINVYKFLKITFKLRVSFSGLNYHNIYGVFTKFFE